MNESSVSNEELVPMPALDQSLSVAKRALLTAEYLFRWQSLATDKVEIARVKASRAIADISAFEYWREVGFYSEREYVKKTFLASESQYYIMRRVGSILRNFPEEDLEEIGMSKCQDLVRLYKHTGGIISEAWKKAAKELTRDQFRHKVRNFINKSQGVPDPEEEEFVTFKILPGYKEIYEIAKEIASHESGSDVLSYIVLGVWVPEYLAGHSEEGARLSGNGYAIIQSIGKQIRSLKNASTKDQACLDRLINEIKTALEFLKA